MRKQFILWLFNNFNKDENDLFWHKKDFQYVKDRYTFEDLEQKYFELHENF